MKSIKLAFLAAALFGLFLFAQPRYSQAAIVENTTAWQVKPGSDTFWTFTLDASGAADNFYLTNLEDQTMLLVSEGTSISGNTIYVWQEDGNYFAGPLLGAEDGKERAGASFFHYHLDQITLSVHSLFSD